MSILEQMFLDAINSGMDICVELTIPGQEDTEFIVNRNKSLRNKLEYYKKTYNEDLVHKNCSDIKIVSIRKIKCEW